MHENIIHSDKSMEMKENGNEEDGKKEDGKVEVEYANRLRANNEN